MPANSSDLPSWITAITSICNCVSLPILLFTLFVLIRQTSLLQQSNYATAYQVARDILQDQDIRNARNYVLNALKNKSYENWDDQDKAEAEKVCQSYDSVGQMVRNKMLPKEYIVDNWLAGLKKSWELLQPFVKDYRAKWDYPKHWDDYEYLAKEAMIAYGKDK
jgi:hypothetical protein